MKMKTLLAELYTHVFLAMKEDVVQLNIPCLMPCNLESKFTFVYIKVYK